MEIKLYDAIFKLPKEERLVTHLFYFKNYSKLQISQYLKVSEEAVKHRLAKAKELLKLSFKERVL